jgi:hypothetical protein
MNVKFIMFCCVAGHMSKIKVHLLFFNAFMHLINARNMEGTKLTGQMFVYTFRTDGKQSWAYTWDCSLSYSFKIIILKL